MSDLEEHYAERIDELEANVDALTAENERLQAELTELEAEETGESTRWFNTWLKADGRLKAAESRLAELTTELAATHREYDRAIDALTAENERLRAELAHITGLLDAANATLERPSRRELAAEARLATAEQALREANRVSEICIRSRDEFAARLATAEGLLGQVRAVHAGIETMLMIRGRDAVVNLGAVYDDLNEALASAQPASPALDAKTCAECRVTTPFAAPGFHHARTCSEVGGQPEAPVVGCPLCGANTFEPHHARCPRPVAPARTEAECPRCNEHYVKGQDDAWQMFPARTEAEQAVLDAMAKADITSEGHFTDERYECDAGLAELARREAAK